MILKVKKKFTFELQVVILPAPNSRKLKKMEKGIVEIGRDFLADFVGLERGVFYTAKKLLFDPLEVVEAYKAKDTRVCTPFSLIVIVFGFFFLTSNKTGTDTFIFVRAGRFAKITGIAAINDVVPFIWSNLPFLMSLFIVVVCFVLSLMTKRLNLSFYDHIVANLYNLAITMVPVSLLILILPLIDFNPNIFNLLMAGTSILMIKMKRLKLRILFYYPEEVRAGLKKPMMVSGFLMAVILLTPMIWLIISGRL